MSWIYRGKELQDEDIPKDAIGFLYLIRDKATGRRYIGRKLLTQAARRQVKGKVKKYRKESDWRDYWSSSPELLESVSERGTDDFDREILMFAPNKALLNYLEEKFLYAVGALEDERWINTNIRAKMYKRNILNKLDVDTAQEMLDYVLKDD